MDYPFHRIRSFIQRNQRLRSYLVVFLRICQRKSCIAIVIRALVNRFFPSADKIGEGYAVVCKGKQGVVVNLLLHPYFCSRPGGRRVAPSFTPGQERQEQTQAKCDRNQFLHVLISHCVMQRSHISRSSQRMTGQRRAMRHAAGPTGRVSRNQFFRFNSRIIITMPSSIVTALMTTSAVIR